MPAYQADLARFEAANTQVLGVSVDHLPCLKAWSRELGDITYPLLSDFWPHGEVARRYGVFLDEEGHSERAVFLADTEGLIRYVDVHDMDELPDNEVVFAELAKLGAARSTRLLEPLGVAGRPGTIPPATPPPESPRLEAPGVTLTAPPPREAAVRAIAEPAAETAATAGALVMYCTEYCPDCRRAREWLNARDIPYVEVDVDTDGTARERAAAFNDGRLHTPTFEFPGGVCVDFKPDVLEELLAPG